MRRFYAAPENFNGSETALSVEESKHLRDVLRLREGEKVSVFDGDGGEFSCEIVSVGRGNITAKLKIIEKIAPIIAESKLDLTLAIALLKGEKFDLVVQKSTEIGVKKIVPLITKRADVKIHDANDAAKKVARWSRIALEAAKQSQRAFVPRIESHAKFEDFLRTSTVQNRILFSERDGESLTNFTESRFDNLTAIVGAEGGWDDSEINFARENGCKIVTFGGGILRAETAAIVVVALLQHLHGNLR